MPGGRGDAPPGGRAGAARHFPFDPLAQGRGHVRGHGAEVAPLLLAQPVGRLYQVSGSNLYLSESSFPETLLPVSVTKLMLGTDGDNSSGTSSVLSPT